MKYHELTSKQDFIVQLYEGALHTIKGTNDIYSPSVQTFWEERFEDLRELTDHDPEFIDELEELVWGMIAMVRANK